MRRMPKPILATIVMSIAMLLLTYSEPASTAAPPKKLIVAIGEELGTLDPSQTEAGSDNLVMGNYSEYLLVKDTNGNLKPGIAASWKMSPDGKEIEFTLRKGVKFHSGDLLTTKDVVFSFDRGKAKSPSLRTKLGSLEKIEIMDDYRFKLHFKMPDVTFIPNRGGGVRIVSRSYYDRVGEEKFVREPAAIGPYKVVRYVPGEYIDLERFEDYYGEKPSVREVRFLFVPDETTKGAKLMAGEVDIINSCPYPLVKNIDQTPGLKTIKYNIEHSTLSILFNTQNPNTPWYDRRVRLAMAYGVDCDSIIKNVLYGIPHRYAHLAPNELGYDPTLKPYPYDPKKAKELLAEAGYPKGFEFKLYWPVGGRNPMLREVAEAIASYFEAIGIRTRLVGEERAAFEKTHRAAKAPTAEFVCYRGAGLAGSVEPIYNLELWYGSKGSYTLYHNPELDKIIEQGKTIPDDKKRAELIKKGVRMVYDDVAVIPIFNTVAVLAMKKNIDFTPTQGILQDIVFVKDVTIR